MVSFIAYKTNVFSNMWIFNVMYWWCHEMTYKYAVYIYIWNKDDMRKWFYGDDYVVLRAPMDDLLWRSHMGRWYFHSIEAVWEMKAQEEWLGCRHDASPMFDILGSTPVWAQCIIFSGFSYYKNLYVLCFQIYLYI